MVNEGQSGLLSLTEPAALLLVDHFMTPFLFFLCPPSSCPSCQLCAAFRSNLSSFPLMSQRPLPIFQQTLVVSPASGHHLAIFANRSQPPLPLQAYGASWLDPFLSSMTHCTLGLVPKSLQPWLFATPWGVAHQSPLLMGFLGKNIGLGCHFLLWGNFLTQGSNLHFICLLHWQVLIYHYFDLGSPQSILASAWVPLPTHYWIEAYG